jgi:hypothetical protein
MTDEFTCRLPRLYLMRNSHRMLQIAKYPQVTRHVVATSPDGTYSWHIRRGNSMGPGCAARETAASLFRASGRGYGRRDSCAIIYNKFTALLSWSSAS